MSHCVSSLEVTGDVSDVRGEYRLRPGEVRFATFQAILVARSRSDLAGPDIPSTAAATEAKARWRSMLLVEPGRLADRLSKAHHSHMGFPWCVVLGALTLLTAVLWVRHDTSRPKDERGANWAALATVATIDGWLWWVAAAAAWAPVWSMIWPLFGANFVLAWILISGLTGVTLQGRRSAYLEGMTGYKPERPR